MIDIEKVKARHTAFFQKTNQTPILCMRKVPKEKQDFSALPSTPARIEDAWTDPVYVVQKTLVTMENTYYGGDTLPIFAPDLGPDFFGALCGGELHFADKKNSWAVPTVTDWATFPDIVFDENNMWYRRMVTLLEAALDTNTDGKYIVGIPDIHADLDALAAIRGTEPLCMDLYDCPEIVEKFQFQIYDLFEQLINRFHALITRKQEGTANWMALWRPDKWYLTQCDFSGIISEADFKKLQLPILKKELDFLSASIYHLDGPSALRYLDTLLELENLDGIQWVQGAGAPPAREWLHVYQKIQQAGKLVQAVIRPEDLPVLLNNLDPRGLMFKCVCKTEKQARETEAYIKNFYA